LSSKIILLDNTGFEYLSEIVVIAKGQVSIKVLENTAALNTPKREVWLCAAIIKKDHFEWVVEKATEIGVSHIVPILTDRTEKKDVAAERLEKIIREASEQSERATLPVLHDVMSLKEALETVPHPHAFHMIGQNISEKDIKNDEPIALFVGPEGGWSPEELHLFETKSVPVHSVGIPVLRAETAAITISAKFLL
jgi:16S rRNA (uracil1498-N3)-methyltransferase